VLRGVKWLPEWTVKLGVELGMVRVFTSHTELLTVHAIDIVKYALSTLGKSFMIGLPKLEFKKHSWKIIPNLLWKSAPTSKHVTTCTSHS
jgi:hypothetical protein